MRYKILIDITLSPEEASAEFIETVQSLLRGITTENKVTIEQVLPLEETDLLI